MDLIELLQERIEKARRAEECARERLKAAPEGVLRAKMERGCLRYLVRKGPGDTNGAYLGDKDRQLLKALEEKAYYGRLEKTARDEAQAIERARKLVDGAPDHRKVFLDIPAEKRHLIAPYEPEPPKRYGLRKPSEGRRGPDSCLVTRNGEKVRSKSELIIADRFTAAGVPYVYECSAALGDEYIGGFMTWHPDFKVRNPRTGKEYYWEHFGMMDDPDYCASCQFKLQMYASNGIFMGKDLIVTTESSKRPLDTEYIDMLIREFLT